METDGKGMGCIDDAPHAVVVAEATDVIAAHLTAEPHPVAEADALMVAARGVVKRLSGGVAQVGCQSSLGSAAKDQYHGSPFLYRCVKWLS